MSTNRIDLDQDAVVPQSTPAPALPVKAKTSPLMVMGARFNIDPGKLLDVLKNTVIRATSKHTPSNEEVAAFVIVANQYNLNPFTREIHAFVKDGCIVPIVGIDGWVRLCNTHKDFDGVEFTAAVDGTDQGMTCRMFVKGRAHPVEITEWLSECRRDTGPWMMKKRMLRHKAYIQCARIAFGFSGLYDEDEARDIVGSDPVPQEIEATVVESVPAITAAPVTKTAALTAKLRSKLGHGGAPKAEAVPVVAEPTPVAPVAQKARVSPVAATPETVRSIKEEVKRLSEDLGRLLKPYRRHNVDELSQQGPRAAGRVARSGAESGVGGPSLRDIPAKLDAGGYSYSRGRSWSVIQVSALLMMGSSDGASHQKRARLKRSFSTSSAMAGNHRPMNFCRRWRPRQVR